MNIEIELLPHQKECFNSDTYITSMSCGIGAGKSYSAALLTIIELLRGKRVLLIAPTYAMIKDVLIRQVLVILDKYKIPYRHNKNNQKISLGSGELILKSNKNADTINGLTEIDTVIIDECRLVSELAFNYAIARQRGVSNAKIYLFGTGCSVAHWFAKNSMAEGTTWIKADIRSNAKYNGDAYVQRMLKMYEDLPEEFKKRELYGLFTDGDEFSLFDKINVNAVKEHGLIQGGLDIAGTGDDYSCIAVFNGNELIHLEKKRTMNEDVLKPWQAQITRLYGVQSWYHDSTGIGNLIVFPNESTPINFGPISHSRFGTNRTRIYFDLKAKLNSGICFGSAYAKKLFENDAMVELMVTKMDSRETAKLKLIGKPEIKKLIGRSPDVADALALASIPPAYSVNYNQMRKLQVRNNPFKGMNGVSKG
jgi:hypothetical protein